MILALYDRDELSIALALLDVGIIFDHTKAASVPLSTVATAAYILFDVCFVKEATVSPMSQNSILKEIPLKQLNQSLWMVSSYFSIFFLVHIYQYILWFMTDLFLGYTDDFIATRPLLLFECKYLSCINLATICHGCNRGRIGFLLAGHCINIRRFFVSR